MASIFDVSKYILAHFDQPISPPQAPKADLPFAGLVPGSNG